MKKIHVLSYFLLAFCCCFNANRLYAQSLDIAINSITVANSLMPGNYPLTGVVRNNGSQTITSFVLQWRVNSGAITTQTINTTLAAGANYNFTTTGTFSITQAVLYTIEASVLSPNGGTDANTANNALTKQCAGIYGTTTKNVLLEEYTAVWCGYCPDGAYRAQQIADADTNVIWLSAHADDIMECADNDPINDAYISGYPSGLIDRYLFSDASAVSLSRGVWSSKANLRQTETAIAALSANTTFNAATRQLSVTATATFMLPTQDEYRINCFVVEDHVTGGSQYDQSNYYSYQGSAAGGPLHPYYNQPSHIVGYDHRNVIRKVLGGAWGTSSSVANPVQAGTPYSYTYNYTLPAAYNANNVYVVVVVQKYNTNNVNDRPIANSLHCNLNAGSQIPITVVAAPPCTLPAAPILVASGTQLCPNGTNGGPTSVLLQATAAAPIGFHYQWQRNGTDLSGATNATYTATLAGNYTAYLTNDNGCTVSANILQITNLPLLNTPTPTCGVMPNSVQMTWAAVSGAAGYEVRTNGGAWQSPNGALSHTISGLLPGQSLSLQLRAAGNYDCQDSPAASLTCAAQACPTITPQFSGLPSTLCSNATPITLSATPAGGFFTGNGTNGNTFSPALAGNGTHTLTYTYSSNPACTYTATATLTVIAPPTTAAFTYSTDNLTLYAQTPATPNHTYLWNYGNGSTANGSSSTYTYPAEGSYNVCLTASNTCGTAAPYCQNINLIDTLPCGGQAQEMWTQYSNGDYITAMAEEGNFMWIGTDVGLVRINKATGSTTFYNTANSGLPNNNIYAIAIDSNGDKWIGTLFGGIAKFNGSTWTVYNTGNSGLPDNYIRAIAIDTNGDKWISTWNSNSGNLAYGNGVTKFDGTTWMTYNSSNSGLPDNDITAITIDSNGDKWIGTMNGGVAKFNGSTWTVYTTSNSGLPSNSIQDIAIDANGDKWIGTWSNGGVAKFNGSTWTVYTTSNSGLPSNSIRAIAIDTNGDKWIGTGGGVAKFNGSTWTVYNTSNSGLPSNGIGVIAIDNNGDKWIHTGGGLVKFNGSTWTVYNTSNSGLPDNSIRAIAIDNNGNKWIGSSYGGLAKFNGSTWTVYNTDNSGLPNDYIQAIAIDTNGDKWIGTQEGGLAKFNGSTWTVYNTSNSGLPNNYISDIAIDSNGDKWIGTWGGGVAKFNGSTWTIYNTSNSGLPSNFIQAIAIDTNGDKWIGTYNGVAKFNGSTWTIYNTSNSGLPDNGITAIAIDTNGDKWIGTNAGYISYGLAKFNGTTWTVYNTDNSGLPSNNIIAIAIDTNGNKWISTEFLDGFSAGIGVGLAKFNDSTWTVYNTNNSGLSDNYINAIAIDTNGDKWIGTVYRGISVLSEIAATPCSCPTVVQPLSAIHSLCEGSAPPLAALASLINYNDPDAQLDYIAWFSNAALTNPLPTNYTANFTATNTCTFQSSTLYAALVCRDSTIAPIPAGSVSLRIYTEPAGVSPVGGCSFAVNNTCGSSLVTVQYNNNGVWSSTPPAGSGVGGAVRNGDIGCYRAFVTGTPDNNNDGSPDCYTSGCIIATCATCPTVTNAINASQNLCAGAFPNFTQAQSNLQYNDPYSQLDGLVWYSNAALTQVLPAGYTAVHSGGCGMQSYTLYAGLVCETSTTPIPAGTFILNVYPVPTTAAPAGGCSLQVLPNCPSGSLVVQYDYGFGTWDVVPPTNPSNGQSLYWRAYVAGSPDADSNGSPDCLQAGIVTANCSACPSVETHAPASPLCYGSSFDLNTLKDTPHPGTWSIISAPIGAVLPTITAGSLLQTNGATAGIYQLSFTLSSTPPNGCPSSSSQAIVVQAPIQPIITAFGNLALCQGESATLSIPPIYAQVQWSNGVTGQYSIAVSESGNYQVTVTGTNACTGVSPAVAVNVSELPTAAFVSSGGTEVNIGTTVLFYNNSTGASYYRWLVNGALSSTTEDFSYLFNTAGTYVITLQATNANDCTASSSQTIVVSNTSVQTLFYGTPTLGNSPLLVQFYHNSTNSTSFFWDFGDGSSSTLPNPQHLYTAPGIYTVALARLTDGTAVNEERQNYIVVQSNNPEAVADFSTTPTNGPAALTVSFTNLSVGASSYAWTFLNSAGQIIGSSSAVNPQFTFELPGVYSVCLAAIGAINTDIECKEQYINVGSQFVDGDLCIVAPETVVPGEEFTVEVWANDLTLLVKAINPILTYNTQYLNWTGIELGDFFSNAIPGITLDNPVLGELQMGITSNTAANGTGMLFRLTFVVQPEPNNPTDVTFGFSLTEAIDNNNNIVSLYTCGNPTTTIETGEFVWPGDANANGVVDNFDYIFAAANFNVTGNVRNVQGITWQPYNAPTYWDANMPYLGEMVNLMHSDASGNGWINNTDISATIINQGLTHNRTGLLANELSDIPALRPDMPTEAHQGDVLLVPIMLGDTLMPFSNLQGITFDLKIDTALLDINTLDIDYYDSVMGNVGSDFSTNYSINNAGVVNMVMARNGLFPIGGYGKMFDLRIKVKQTAPIDTYANIGVYNLSGLDGNLNLLELATAHDSTRIVPVISLGNNPVLQPTVGSIKVYPNPTADRLMVVLPSNYVGITDFVLYNTAGQVVYRCRLHTQAGQVSRIALPNDLANGVYYLQALQENKMAKAKVVVAK